MNKTCSNCRFWQPRNDQSIFGGCKNEELLCDNVPDLHAQGILIMIDEGETKGKSKLFPGKDFGCIHFQGNEFYRDETKRRKQIQDSILRDQDDEEEENEIPIDEA